MLRQALRRAAEEHGAAGLRVLLLMTASGAMKSLQLLALLRCVNGSQRR